MSTVAGSVTLGERTVNRGSTLTDVNGPDPPGRYGFDMHAARPIPGGPLKDRNLISLADLGPADVAFVQALARRLQTAPADDPGTPLLRGRIVGVLGDAPVDPAFAAAVQQLGASLAAVSAGLLPAGDAARLERSAQWLGRLYDALDVTDPELAPRLARHSRVPVFGGLSAARHPFHALCVDLAPPEAQPQVLLIKALLVATLH